MPKPASPYKKIFLARYPEEANHYPRHSIIKKMLDDWKLKKPSELYGQQVDPPDERTMRVWRTEVENAGQEPWTDQQWDGESANHVPIGWLWGLDWFSRATGWRKPLSQTQVDHAQRLYTSLNDLDLSAVWILVNEYAIQDQIRHSYTEAYFERLTTVESLNQIVAIKPWIARNSEAYLQLTDALPPFGEPDPEAIPINTFPYSRPLGPPLFLASRVDHASRHDDEFMERLTVHLSHLIGNPFNRDRPVSQYLREEVIEQFEHDDYEGMSWQEILVKEHIG